MNTLHRLTGALRLEHERPQTAAGLRAALSLTVPFAVGVAAGDVQVGGLVANGAFLVALSNVGGTYLIRARVTAVALPAIPLTAFVAVLVGNETLLAAALAAVWMVVWSLTPLWGTRYAFLGLNVAVAFVVYPSMPGSWSTAWETMWWTALGAAWAALLSVAMWPLFAARPGRAALAESFRLEARVARDLSGGFEGADRWAAASRTRSLGQVADVLAVIDTSPTVEREDLLALFERSHAIAQQLILLADQSDGGLPAETAADAARRCERIATDLLDERWWRRNDRGGNRCAPKRCVAAADKLLADLGGALPADPHLRRRYRDRDPAAGDVRARVRSALTLDSLLFRHAIRLAVAVALAVVLSVFANISSGYWIPMTVILVLKPDIGATLDRAVQRSLATVAGAILGAVIVVTVDSDIALVAILFPLAWFLVAMVPLNYFFWAIAITPLAIVVRDTGDLGDWGLAVERAANSLAGVAIALAAGFVLWPSWTRLRLPVAVSRLMDAFGSWTSQVLAAVEGGAPDEDQLGFDPDSPHMRVLRDRTNVAIAVDQLDAELPHRPRYVAAARSFQVASIAYTDAVAELAQRVETGPALPSESVSELAADVAAVFTTGEGGVEPPRSTSGDTDVDRLATRLAWLARARADVETAAAVGVSRDRP